MPGNEQGIVLKRYSGFHYVQTENQEILECIIRGKTKNQGIIAGDRVIVSRIGPGKGVIEKILPRTAQLVRPAIANVNRVMVVMSCSQPDPSLKLLDRLLVQIEFVGLTAFIVLNKSDLAPAEPEVHTILEDYPKIGYPVYLTSARQLKGIEELRHALAGHVTVMAGPSGAGKTSLLNLLVPDVQRETGEVSSKIGRGRHTTRHAELFPLPDGGWIADTPGFSVIETPAVKRRELADLFIEFKNYSDNCRFNDCLHYKETDCGVRQAVDKGLILSSRYQTYTAMLEEVIENERCY